MRDSAPCCAAVAWWSSMSPERAAQEGCPVDHGAVTAAPLHWDETGHGTLAHWPGARRISWLTRYGLPRWGLNASSRRGDPVARMTVDPALRADPYPGYEDMRATSRLVRGRLTYATVNHALAKEVLRSPSFHAGTELGPLPAWMGRLSARFTDQHDLGPVDAPSMLAVNGALHTGYRKLVSRAFAAKNVAQQEDRIREIASELLDAIVADGVDEFDLVARYAGQLPVQVIADMLGVPADDRDRLLRWGDGAALMLDPDLSWSQYRHATQGLRQLHDWVADQIVELRRSPADTLLGRLVAMEGDDELTDVELKMVAMLTLGAGFETTVNLVANAVDLLERFPGQRDAAATHGWAGAVEESLRFEPPVQLTIRTAIEDVTLGGTELHRGSTVLAMIGGANRDPEVFEEPQTFDVTRTNADQHLSLSDGPHYCLGANLAKLEGRIALEMLYERFPDLHVVAGGVRRTNRVLRGWERLPVAA